MSVVLPAPVGPSRPYTSPRRTRRSTPSSATWRPNRLTTPSTSTAKASSVGILVPPRWPHRAEPLLRQLDRDVLQGHGEADRPLGHPPRDQVEQDRPHQQLHREHRVHRPEPAGGHLL